MKDGECECACLELCGEFRKLFRCVGLNAPNLRPAFDDGVHNLVEAILARRAGHTINGQQIQVGSPGAKTHRDGHAILDADNSRFGRHACKAEGIHDMTKVCMSATGRSCVCSESAEDLCPKVGPIGAPRYAFQSCVLYKLCRPIFHVVFSRKYTQVKS